MGMEGIGRRCCDAAFWLAKWNWRCRSCWVTWSPEGQKALFEIAKLAIKQNAWGTYQTYCKLWFLHNVGEKSRKLLADLYNHVFIYFVLSNA